MQLVKQYPREVANLLKTADLGNDPETQQIELEKLTIDLCTIDGASRARLGRSRDADKPIVVAHHKKRFYVIDGRHRVMQRFYAANPTVKAIVIDADDDGPTKKKEKPHYAHSAVVTDKPVS